MFNSYLTVACISLLGVILIGLLAPPKEIPQPTSLSIPANTRLSCSVDRIVDGDTVHAFCNGHKLKIRLSGMDSPEMEQSPWGESAKFALKELLKENRFNLEYQGIDIYNRALGVIYSNNQDINLKMIEMGQAVAYKADTTPTNYYEAEQIAKKNKIGIWSTQGAQQDPKKWRRYHQK